MEFRHFVRGALALALLGSASCSAMQDMIALGDDPKGALVKDAGPGTCCVNKQFFECPDGPSTLECGGSPVEMTMCADKCPLGDDACKERCVAEHAPNPSGCARAEARDGECK